MIRIACVLLALILILPATAARSADNLLIGTWKLKSYVREVAATGERYNERGEHPTAILATRPTAACMRSSPGKIA
jgi:hypothetical protein